MWQSPRTETNSLEKALCSILGEGWQGKSDSTALRVCSMDAYRHQLHKPPRSIPVPRVYIQSFHIHLFIFIFVKIWPPLYEFVNKHLNRVGPTAQRQVSGSQNGPEQSGEWYLDQVRSVSISCMSTKNHAWRNIKLVNLTNCDDFFKPNVFIACAQVLQLIMALISYVLVHSKFL